MSQDQDELLERWRESELRSRAGRAARPEPHRGRALVVCVAVVAAGYGVGSLQPGETVTPQTGEAVARSARGAQPRAGRAAKGSPRPIPYRASMRAAWRYAKRRGGLVSFAVVDTAGRLRGRDGGRRYVSASVVKAMLLVAELRRLSREESALDPASEALLTAMITHSDNDSADTIFLRVGDAGLVAVARAAGMRRFDPGGYWARARVTAADLARLFSRLPRVLPARHRRTALRMLASIVREQRWGVARAAAGEWTVRFKGGWRETGLGQLVHQAARLEREEDDLAIAVLTDGQPSRVYAIHTIRGIAERLLRTAAG